MTVAAEGARSGWGRRLLWATLAVSLVINIFFVGTMVWLRINAEPRAVWPALVHAIGSHLKLKEEKNEAFKRLVMETRQNTRSALTRIAAPAALSDGRNVLQKGVTVVADSAFGQVELFGNHLQRKEFVGHGTLVCPQQRGSATYRLRLSH